MADPFKVQEDVDSLMGEKEAADRARIYASLIGALSHYVNNDDWEMCVRLVRRREKEKSDEKSDETIY